MQSPTVSTYPMYEPPTVSIELTADEIEEVIASLRTLFPVGNYRITKINNLIEKLQYKL